MRKFVTTTPAVPPMKKPIAAPGGIPTPSKPPVIIPVAPVSW